MEPLSALSVAAAVAQFIDYGLKIVGNAREIRGSLSGATEENWRLEFATNIDRRFREKFVTSSLGGFPEEETMLNDLVTECRSLSTQLLDLLNKIKAKDPKSLIQVTLSSVRSKLHEKDKVMLQRRLDECQVRLDRLLSALSRSEVKEHLERLVVSSEVTSRNISLLRSQAQQLRSGTELTSIGPETREQLRDIFGLAQSLSAKATQRRVLSLLAFPGMRDRIDIVEKAHKATFSWIFDDVTSPKADSDESPVALLDETGRQKAADFVKWLSSGTGVYHIAGKLGSGKSTMMKYLAGQSRVREEVQKWAGDKKLVVASFFFWRRGTPLQRSLFGLLRSLLHDALEQRPDLVPEVLPDTWNMVRCSPGGLYPSSTEITNDCVQSAFARLLKCSELFDDVKFFLIIDGLDEYEETLQDDFKAMAQLLSSWTQTAPNGVKLCVSSREYNVFLNFFSPEKRMRLQDLTLTDMKRYIQERLQELHQDDLGRIVQTITEKANGIFLWVALVVKSIRARLEDGCGTSMIEDEVNSLPDELEGLFQYLLASINKSYRTKAYQTFAMIQCLPINDGQPVRLSLLAYSFLENYDVGSEFAQRPNPLLFPLTETARCQRESAAQKRLNAHCQGLFELDQDMSLRHTHRSVVEFLAQHLQQTPTAKSVLAEFQPAHAVSQLILAELRCRPRDSYWMERMRGSSFPRVAFRIRAALVVRIAAELDSLPYSYLEALRSAANSVIPEHLDRDVLMRNDTPQFPVLGYHWDPASVLNGCAMFGMHEYLDYATDADPSTIDNNDKVASLAFFEIQSNFAHWLQGHGIKPSSTPLGCFAVLLRRGISPNAAIHTTPWTKKTHLPWGLTLWEHLVYYLALHAPPSTSISSLGRIIIQFLEQGANPNIRIALEGRPPTQRSVGPLDTDEQSEKDWSIELWKRQVNGQRPRLQRTKGGVARPDIKLSFGKRLGNGTVIIRGLFSSRNDLAYDDAEISYFNFIISRGGEISFEDFVEFCNFEHKEAILELCARNKRLLRTSTKTKPEAEDRGENPGALYNTKERENQELASEVQDSPQVSSGVGLVMPAEPGVVAGNGPVLSEDEESEHEEPRCEKPEQEGLKREESKHEESKHEEHKHEEHKHEEHEKSKQEDHKHEEHQLQELKHDRQTQTLYQRLTKSRAVDVTLAILAALVLSQLLQVLS